MVSLYLASKSRFFSSFLSCCTNHVARFAFFVAFFVWFAITPLLPEIQKTLNLDQRQIWHSNIANVAGTILIRLVLGPLCDTVGPRILFTFVLLFASIPTACTGLVKDAEGLIFLRLFIGVAGGSFVMCQYWTSRMFAKEIVGTANALVGGWGNLGAGVTQLIMGTGLFPLFKQIFEDEPDPAESAWRHVCIVPAIVAFGTGIVIYRISDDAPKGNYNEMKRHGTMAEVSAVGSFFSAASNFNTWLLFIQYGCCFGVELTMNNAAALYFHNKFPLTTEEAAAIASVFGWMNLFARGLGGWYSDAMNKKIGMRGRLYVQLAFLLCEGALVLIFANTDSLMGAVLVMIIFSVFVQAAEGSSYGIVPYIDPPSTGSVAGIVGAGGNVGAVGFGMGFRQLNDRDAFFIMGCTIMASAVTTVLITINGHRGILFGKDDEPPKKRRKATQGLS
jgi:NNP family nitrate/nitrite transporter-like MFS transporter